MCGVIGIISLEPVAERLYRAALRLRNRGQQSTGIITYDGDFFQSHHGLGSAVDAFRNYDLKQLKGYIGCAHTRYTTTGKSSPEMLLKNAQPVLSEKPGIATSANGYLVNIVLQREKLNKQGWFFNTEVDAKVLQATLCTNLWSAIQKANSTEDYAKALFRAVEETNKELIGAYSVVNVLPRGLFAFKDPHGIRPLCYAKRKHNNKVIEVAFSSESSIFNYFGDYTEITELKPGETIFVEKDSLNIFSIQVTPGREAFCYFEYTYFARPDSKFNGKLVQKVRQSLGEMLAQECQDIKNRIDVIVPVPATANSAALSFARAIGRSEAYTEAIIKDWDVRSFQETSQEKREKAVDDKFMYLREFIEGKNIILVDDSNVRGTTAKKHIAKLRQLGVKEVHYVFYTPPIIQSCFYGIDFPDRSELIATGRQISEIAKIIDADSVHYISIDNLVKGIDIPKERLCLACLTGDYPTDVKEAVERLKLRREERNSRC